MLCHKKYGLIFGKPPFKLSASKVLLLNKKLKLLRRYVPLEFSGRKTRAITEVKRYKATELRLFLLYTGAVVLKGVVSKRIYHLFLMLSIATLIFANRELCQKENYTSFADSLMEHFVINCMKTYGLGFVSLNVHSLLHIGDFVRRYENLDNFSAFPFENYMQQFKKKLRKRSQALQQIVKRILEKQTLCTPLNRVQTPCTNYYVSHNDGPLLTGLTSPQYKKLVAVDFTINVSKFADSFVQLIDNTVIRVQNFATHMNGEIHALGVSYKSNGNFFSKPCPSNFVNIFLVKTTGKFGSWNVKYIKKKIFVMDWDNQLLCFPLLHL